MANVYQGDLLTATAAPVQSEFDTTRTWQWLRGSTAISGATSSTYTVQASDRGNTLSVKQIEKSVAGTTEAIRSVTAPDFYPTDLFASGEEGAFYDPSPSTCFTDTGGTTAATYGDAIAYLQDLSGNGNHATQTTAASRPILARVPETGRRNLLERTEEFDNAYWTRANATVTANDYVAPDGNTTADRLVENATTNIHYLTLGMSATSGQQYTLSIYAKADDRDVLQFVFSSVTFGSNAWANFNLATGETGTVGSSASASITPIGSGWYRCSLTATATFTGSGSNSFALQTSDTAARADSYFGDGASGIYIWGAQFEVGTSSTDYQKVVSEYDVTEAGVTSLEYLSFDGSDDGMATASIDFTSTDEMSVFAGVRKLSDAAGQGIITEFTNVSTNPGAFSLFAGSTTSTRRFSWSTATPQAFIGTADFAGDQTVVDTLTIDRSGTTTTTILFPRLNGAAAIQSEVINANTGANFANASLYIGYRGTGGSFLNGNLYGLIVRGASSTTGEITNTEAYLAAKSGVTIA
jgi:hypothetical protein